MSEHKSSQNHSHTNLQPVQIQTQSSNCFQTPIPVSSGGANQQNQDHLIYNQLQVVLDSLYNQENKQGSNKVVGEALR